MATEDKEIAGHEYDGIKEFDNPLPNWWLVTFFGTIIFSFVYYIHYEFGGGPTLAQELSTAMSQIEQAAKKSAPPADSETEEMLAAAGSTPEALKLGQTTFDGKCATCHGPQLQGLIGPNLTDKFWIHGKGTHKDILTVVKDGVADKGMPPWGALLKKDELYAVVGYIFSKKGSNPPNPKAPQGAEVQ